MPAQDQTVRMSAAHFHQLSFASVAARLALLAADFAATAWFGHANTPFNPEPDTLSAQAFAVQLAYDGNMNVTDPPAPLRLNLQRDLQLEIDWADGKRCVYPISLLRTMCPCATCREVRKDSQAGKSSLRILPGNFTKPITALSAELVGNYALRIEWSDRHDAGIYSFRYLRDICPS